MQEGELILGRHHHREDAGAPSGFVPCVPQAAMAAVVSAAAAPPPSAQEQPPLVGEPLTDGDEPPIVIAEAYLTPATAAEELHPSVTAVFVTSVPFEAVADPGDAPPPVMQPPNTPPLAASAVPYAGEPSAAGAAQALVVATGRAQIVPSAERGDGGPPMTVEEALAAASAEGISLEPSANAAGYRGVKVSTR